MTADAAHPASGLARELDGLPDEAKTLLRTVLSRRGWLQPAEVQSLKKILRLETPELMLRLCGIARHYAVPPISGFRVGAVAQGVHVTDTSGESALYLGGNLEFAGQPLLFSIHAEQAAVNLAWLGGETGIRALAVDAAPCGFCRQFLWELATSKDLVLFIRSGTDGEYLSHPLRTFLPEAFGPADLGKAAGFMDPALISLRSERVEPSADPLICEAFEAAQRSYAPYSSGYAGCALESASGRIYSGRYVENAAYNPSLTAMASAISAHRMSSMLPPGEVIHRAVLVQAKSTISQGEVCRAMLASYAPHAAFQLVEVELVQAS